MSSGEQRRLSRISARTKDVINAAQESCEESAAHIKSSRSAIARSLELLRRRFDGFDRG